jgi:large subunit ribosomal protein L20
MITKKKHKKILKMAKGYRGARSRRFKCAKEAVYHALKYSYIHRRTKKREFRRLWIAKINAAVRSAGMTYSQFIHGLKEKGIKLDRKQLAHLAEHEPEVFAEILERVKEG